MSYLALYRKFRPKTFDEVIGQDHISITLKNMVKSGNVAHAFLFTGTRGTGKTSMAKILAKTVACENPVDGNACGKCPSCLALSRPDSMDVIEIDAASNNGVDDLRDLREKAQFKPAVAKKKVYIIDEVHMLTISAFNALLKTLEEPPEHVIFILATTEVHKLPQTILSRCLRFDFRLIPTNTISAYLEKVFKEINRDFEKEALNLIAKAGEGSMRDALSIADVCLSASLDKITFELVNDQIGNLSRDSSISLFNCIKNKDQAKMLEGLNFTLNSGKSVPLVLKSLVSLVRDLLILNLEPNSTILSYPKDVIDELKTVASGVDNSLLVWLLQELTEVEAKLKYSSTPKILLECALLKCTMEKSGLSNLALSRRRMALEEKLNNLINNSPRQ